MYLKYLNLLAYVENPVLNLTRHVILYFDVSAMLLEDVFPPPYM